MTIATQEADQEVKSSKFAASAFIRNAHIAGATRFMLSYSTLGTSTFLLDSMQKVYGGLWVGGNATLTVRTIIFQPNEINKLVGGEDVTFAIPLLDIENIAVRFGIWTKIIDIETEGATISLRCYSARSRAEDIRKAVRSAQG